MTDILQKVYVFDQLESAFQNMWSSTDSRKRLVEPDSLCDIIEMKVCKVAACWWAVAPLRNRVDDTFRWCAFNKGSYWPIQIWMHFKYTVNMLIMLLPG